MKILAFEYKLPGVTAESISQYANAETFRIWELHQQGVIREIYFRADRNEIVLTLECENLDLARQVLKTLPSGRQGLTYFELIPLRAYTGFESLFQIGESNKHGQNS